MNILFYTSFNSRSRDTESLIQGFIKTGHTVYVLTQKEKGPYHEMTAGFGAKTFGVAFKRWPLLLFILKHLFYLIRFSKKNNIDIIYAHLEEPGLIAVLAQYFIRSKVVVCRHIVDEAYLFNNRNFILLNKVVYSLARCIVVVSERAKRFMIEKEKIKADKIFFIPLGYNFDLYTPPNKNKVQQIRTEYQSQLLIITACRLVPAKRPMTSINITESLLQKGLDCKLLLLGEGPQQAELISYVKSKKIDQRVFILGHKSNLMDYLDAADILLHPSLLDSSSVIIKEAGLLGKPVITCKNVGDVDEYLKHNENAFLIDKDNPEQEACTVLNEIYNNKTAVSIEQTGARLQKDIHRLFTVDNAMNAYLQLQAKLFTPD